MLSNFIIFRIYLSVAILILFPVCYFLTIELLDQIIYYYLVWKNFRGEKKQIIDLSDVTFLFNYFFTREQFFQCIKLFHMINVIEKESSFLLGLCYYNLSCLFIARYYYIKALRFDEKDNIRVLQNLALVCRDLKDKSMMLEVCSKIRSIDPENSVLLKLMS